MIWSNFEEIHRNLNETSVEVYREKQLDNTGQHGGGAAIMTIMHKSLLCSAELGSAASISYNKPWIW